MRKQNIFTIRSYEKDKAGMVLHTLSINNKVKYRDIGYSVARQIVKQWIKNGDIIQEAIGDNVHYHQQIYNEGYFENVGRRERSYLLN